MTLAFEQHGTGVPVLALHGWGPDRRIMSGFLEPVFASRPGYRRLYPDLPGAGATPLGDATSTDDLLAAVEQFVDEQLGDLPFVLVGESFGGLLAVSLTRTRPDQVLGTALICPVAQVHPSHRRRAARQVLRTQPGALDGGDPRAAEGFAAVAVNATAEARLRYDHEVHPGLSTTDHAGLARLRPGPRLAAAAGPAPGAPCTRPVLVVTGRQDSVVGWRDQVPLLDDHHRATFVVLDLAGHNAQIDQPVLVTALLHEWLDRVEHEPPTP